MNALTIIAEPVTYLPAIPAPEIEVAYQYALNEKAPGTRAGYAADFRLFEGWCRVRGVSALPASPETVCGYLANLAQGALMPATISRRCSAIRYAHKLANLESPTDKEAVRATMRGIRRTVQLPSKRKAPVLAEHAKAMASAAPVGMRGIVNRALVVLR